VEVSVAGLVVVAEEDGGVETGRDFVEQILGAGEVVGSRAKVSAEEGGGPGFYTGLGGSVHGRGLWFFW
jgi:hypothetical protein